MNDTSELDALKARVKELEAAPAPAPGLGGFSGVAALAGLVPRWLVIAGGAVFLAWAGFEIYINAQLTVVQLNVNKAKGCEDRGLIWYNHPGTKAYDDWRKDCADFLQKSQQLVEKPKRTDGKDKYDDLSDASVLGEFTGVEPNFNELTHSDGSLAVKLCVYRQALRLISSDGYNQEDAVRTAAEHCPSQPRPATPSDGK